MLIATRKAADFLCRPARMHSAIAKVSAADRAEIKRLTDLQATLEPRLRRAFLDAVDQVRSQVDIDEIVALLRDGRAEEAVAHVSDDLMRAGFAPLTAAITDATFVAARSAAALIPTPTGVAYTFGATNPKTVELLRGYEMNLIRDISADQLASVRRVITEGVTAGRNPIDVARDVRQFIGLTDRQARAVANYRAGLEAGDTSVLQRALRDKRFDGTVRRAAAEDTPLSAAQVDRMVERYQARYLKYRSEVIARSEAIRAVSVGNHEAWVQAAADGTVEADAVRRFWVPTQDDKTREAHLAIPDDNPDGVGLDEPFDSELGPIMYPGDPAADPENTIECRCAVFLRYQPPVDE